MINVSLDTAIKLKEAGRNKDTYFVWVEGGKLGKPSQSEIHPTEVMKSRIVLADSAYSLYSAPTAQEILDELPNDIGGYTLTINKILYGEGNYCSGYLNRKLKGPEGKGTGYVGINLAESLARLRIRAKENDYLSS